VKALTKRKKELGDKRFGEAKDKLYALLEEAEAQQKKAKAAAEAAQDGEEEADAPALPGRRRWCRCCASCERARCGCTR
jgi:hypothetical protein